MLAAGIKTPVPLDELESHLREEIERQVKSGLSEPIAFEVSVRQVGQPQVLRSEFKKVERITVRQHKSSRFFGLCVIAAIPLTFIMWATLEFLRSDYSPLRNLLSEYLAGPFSFLGRAAAFMLAAALLIVLVGLRLSVRPSGFLTASCVLLGVVGISVGLSTAFPADVWPSDGSRPTFAWANIIPILSAVRVYALLLALLLTLPSAYKRDERWRPFSRVTRFLGFLMLAFGVGFMFAPFDLRGLVQRGVAGVIGTWLLLTGLRLRQAMPSTHGPAAL
jgi:hypothetical protein